MRKPILGLVALFAASASLAHPEIDRLVAESARAPQVAFERTSRITMDGKPTVVMVDRFDPRAPAGRRWTLLTVDGRAPTADDVKRYAKQNSEDDVPGFHRLHELLEGKPPTCTAAAGNTLCRWPNLAAGAVRMKGPDLSERLSAEVALEPAAGRIIPASVRVYAAQPFTIMAVAKMHKLDVVSTYVPGRNGVPFLAAQNIDVDVTAPFGKGAKSHTEVRFRPL